MPSKQWKFIFLSLKKNPCPGPLSHDPFLHPESGHSSWWGSRSSLILQPQLQRGRHQKIALPHPLEEFWKILEFFHIVLKRMPQWPPFTHTTTSNCKRGWWQCFQLQTETLIPEEGGTLGCKNNPTLWPPWNLKMKTQSFDCELAILVHFFWKILSLKGKGSKAWTLWWRESPEMRDFPFSGEER